MPAGLNTIDCLLILFRGRGHDVICINGSSDITNDYVEKLFKRSTSSLPYGTAGSGRGVEKRAVFRENWNCQPMRRALLILSISKNRCHGSRLGTTYHFSSKSCLSPSFRCLSGRISLVSRGATSTTVSQNSRISLEII